MALGFLAAEWVGLHHRATAAVCGDHGDAAPIADRASGEAWSGEGEAEAGDRVFASEQGGGAAISGDACQLCRSWRERSVAPATSLVVKPAYAEQAAAPATASQGDARDINVVALAPKTSPPA